MQSFIFFWSVIGYQCMFRYWLVDEIILFVAPYIQGDGIRLFTEIPGPSSWEMTGNKCFRSGICRLAYKRIE